VKTLKSLCLGAALALAATSAMADDHVIVESVDGIFAGVFSAPSPALVAGNINQNVALIPVTTGAKGSQTPITVQGLCGTYNVMPVWITRSNTVLASQGGGASLTLGQTIATGDAAVKAVTAILQSAGGPTINEVASLQDCSKTH